MPTKVNITGIDIFSNKKYVDSFSAHATVNVPIITRTPYTFIGVDSDGYAILMDKNGQIKDDLFPPTPLPTEDSTVFVLRALGQEKIL